MIQRFAYHVALVIAAIGALMAPPAILAYFQQDFSTASKFAFSALTIIFLAGALITAMRGSAGGGGMRDAAAVFAAIWFATPLAAAAPLWLQGFSFIDGYFEATSALTTTGALVDPVRAYASDAYVLWRAELQWLGGFLTIIAAAAVISRAAVLGAAMPLPLAARGESGSVLRIARVAGQRLIGVYGLITGLAFVALIFAGLPVFDALCLAMSSIATAGFAPRPEGLDAYAGPWVASIVHAAAIAGAMNFALHHAILNRTKDAIAKDRETVAMAIALAGLAAAIWLSAPSADPANAARSLGAAIGVLTTSGYGLESGAAPLGVAVVGAIIGGSALSTAGGVKLGRVVILTTSLHAELWRLAHPHGLINRPGASRRVGFGVWIFFIGFVLTSASVMLTISLFGHPFHVSLAAAVGLLSNTGPLLALAVEGRPSYDIFAPDLRLLMAFVMALGRLEAVAVFLFFHRAFWRS